MPNLHLAVLHDGTIVFSRALAMESGLDDGKEISVFYSLPAKCLVIAPLPKNSMGVPVRRNAKGSLVAERAVDFLEQFGVLSRRRAYAARWNKERRWLVVPMKPTRRTPHSAGRSRD